jgi:predicted O-methyltransferase YrrM
MSTRTIALTDDLHRYLLDVSLREPEVLARLRAETARLPEGTMQISPEQGQLMALLVRLIEARWIIEIGTFTGYSALAMALALPPGGRLTALDISPEWTAIAARYWRDAGVAGRIDLVLGPALASLDRLIADGRAGEADIVFIDADKETYVDYFERALVLLRPGGLVMVDNTLWYGRVVDPAETGHSTRGVRAFNARISRDERVDLSLVPIGDGLTLARKR